MGGEKFHLGALVDSAAETEALLTANRFAFQRQDTRFQMMFADRGFKWECVLDCRESAVVIYGRYPFPIRERERARRVCEEVNRRVLFGCMLLLEDRLVFRTGADLFDAYSAYEHIGRMLEYNANVMTRFWRRVSLCAAVRGADSADSADGANEISETSMTETSRESTSL